MSKNYDDFRRSLASHRRETVIHVAGNGECDDMDIVIPGPLTEKLTMAQVLDDVRDALDRLDYAAVSALMLAGAVIADELERERLTDLGAEDESPRMRAALLALDALRDLIAGRYDNAARGLRAASLPCDEADRSR